MKALVFGSLNIDKVYTLQHLPEKGETLYSDNYEIHAGGKGLNQSVSLAKAGMNVYMAGKIGTDGLFLKEYLEKYDVNTDNIKVSDTFTGHAIIEVDKDGQNQMILYSGANGKITESYCDTLLENFNKNDLILMQYETSCTEYMIKKAKNKGLITAFNPSPFVKELKDFPFELVDYLILNESEAKSLSECDNISECKKKLSDLTKGKVIITLGADGAVYTDGRTTVKVPAFKVNAADTTGAGDTFTGYFLSEYLRNKDIKNALITASAAAALVVRKIGAAETIPDKTEVIGFLNRNI